MKLTNLSNSIRFLMTLALLMLVTSIEAQTARKFTLNLTDDGKAQMVCFLPQTPSGKAIVGVPGGGYSVLSNTHEGTMASDWLNKQGIAYFVVNYRLPNGDRTIPISDVEQGFRIVRDSAKIWSINPNDVGIMGFSAGGHLASVISTHSAFEVRPNFSILFYPVISMDERVSHKWSCVNFLGEEGQKDKALVRDFSTMNAVRSHLTPPAIIITATGDHGFGFGPWFKYREQLLSDLGAWLNARQTPKPDAIRVACVGNSITDGHGIDMRSAYSYPAELQKLLGKDYWVKNFGVSGRTMLNKGDQPYMKEMAWADAQAFKPDVVIIKLGTNDSKPQNWQHGAEFRQDLEQMILTLCPELAQPAKKAKKVKKATPVLPKKPRILLCTPIPALKATWGISESVIANEIIPIQQEVAKKYGLQVIDLHSLFVGEGAGMLADGIHPDGKGAHKLAEIIADAMKTK